MKNELSISVIQTSLFWEDKTKNVEHFANLIAQVIQPVDIIVLPETFVTGFSMKKGVAQKDNSVIEWMQELAKKQSTAIAGSFFVEENGNYFNRFHFVEPDGKLTIYNKRHLFRLTNEQELFTQGDQQVIVKYKGWNISLMVCYDLRFPVWMRRTDSHDFDAIILVANWPERRSHAWKALLQARAIENQCYVIGANRVGTDGTGMLHSGDSMIIDPMGKPLATGKPFTGEIIHSVISKSTVESVRKNLPFYDNRDAFTISI